MRDYLVEACETIDAAMFSGDAFEDSATRAALVEYMKRWVGQMEVITRRDP